MKQPRVAIVSTYPPRQCGIATFTQDLFLGMQGASGEEQGSLVQAHQIVTIDSAHYGREYPEEVRLLISNQRRDDYRDAAELLNLSPVDVISLQHEYGIFGGEDGSHIIYLLKALRKPVVTTLHTVLDEPTPGQRETLATICALSTFVVVQAQRAVDIMVEVYGVPRRKIVPIHHGAPDVPFLDPAFYKDQCGAEGRRVVLTFGLLSPGKGIENAIEAFARVVRDFPDALYIVLGATHPEVKRQYGEAYRRSLEQLVREKGLEKNVVFKNQFVTKEQLLKYLVAADIYVTPYLARNQIVSGTLAYAVACGKAIISTPYWYAEEILAGGRGILVPFGDHDALARQLRLLLSDQKLRDRLRKRAYRFGRQMIWRETAGSYLRLFARATSENKTFTAAVDREPITGRAFLPDINLNHLRAMTDDVGLLQHAVFATPDRNHGYCTDDNARALIVCAMNRRLLADDGILPLLQVYLAFINHAIDRNTGRARNFLSYERRWLEEQGSEDSHGRTVWALGFCVAHVDVDSVSHLAISLFARALAASAPLKSPRARCFVVLGCVEYLKRFPGDREARSIVREFAGGLLASLTANSSPDWVWFEDILTYENARLPQALIAAGRLLGDDALIEGGLRSLTWLLSIQLDAGGERLSLVGTNGWYRRGGERARFDQQPVEIPALIDACYEAYLATRSEKWLDTIESCFGWFFGANDLYEVIYDFTTGGCRDGLQPVGINQNEGAESTLSWLMTLHRMHQIGHERFVGATMTAAAQEEAAAVLADGDGAGERSRPSA